LTELQTHCSDSPHAEILDRWFGQIHGYSQQFVLDLEPVLSRLVCSFVEQNKHSIPSNSVDSDALLHLRGDDFTPLVFPVRTLGLCFTFRVYLIKSLAPFYAVRGHQSALDAIEVTRKRCWKYDWVVEFDIKGLFDNINHELLMKAVKKHCDCQWILLYVERWLKVPMKQLDGKIEERTKGTPQGGVVSPILANLFLHYAFDVWVRKVMPYIPFCRYADDGLLHCSSQQQAENVLRRIAERFAQCGLEIHPDKSKIVYCKDVNRPGNYPCISFDFLGYTFRPRRCVDKQGRIHPNFLPAISKTAKKSIRREIRSWHIQLKNDKSLEDLSKMFNPILRGWHNYYGRFYSSELGRVWFNVNRYLIQWVRRKYKRFAGHKSRAREYLSRQAYANPKLFVHWEQGVMPKKLDSGSRMS
jgi:RNA-directed DNA polymerase